MNTRKSRARFNNFRILLNSGCSSTILTIRLTEKLNPQRYAVMQWNTQSGNVAKSMRVKIDFTLHELRVTNIVTRNCHVDESAKGRYEMILGRDLLTEL